MFNKYLVVIFREKLYKNFFFAFLILVLSLSYLTIFADGFKNFPLKGGIDLNLMELFFISILVSSVVYVLSLSMDVFQSMKGEAEIGASVERSVSTSYEALIREFERKSSQEINRISKSISSTADVLIKKNVKEAVNEKLGNNVISVLGELLSDKTLNESRRLKIETDLSDRFDRMRDRSLQYAEKARIQSNFYRNFAFMFLATGSIIILISVFNHINFYSISNLNYEKKIEWSSIVMRHFPTISSAILFEVIAVIMFRYHTKSFEYMRYFSNEATNIDARRLAFLAAMTFNDGSQLPDLIRRLDATERNFLIDKNQRTLEMASNENENKILDIILQRLPERKTGVHSTPRKRARKSKDEAENG